jgi:hypothetical protein
MNPIDRNDFGIVFYGVYGIAAPSYTDILGQSRQAVTLVKNTETFMQSSVESAYFKVGDMSKFALEVEIKTWTSSATVDLTLHGDVVNAAAIDSTSPKIVTFNNDTVSSANKHTFAALGKTLLQTANLGAVATGALGVLYADTTPPGTIEIIVRMRVGR